MKILKRIFKIIAAIILVPTVGLVAFILYADATDMEFKSNETEMAIQTTLGMELAPEAEADSEQTDSEPIKESPADDVEANVEADAEAGSTTNSSEAATGGSITAAKYEQIQNDMTYQELVSLIGEEGKLTAESETQGSKTVMYEWTADDGWGTAIIVLQDNRVINKSQTGIAENAQTAPITLAQYNKIEEGMTYDKVVEIVGGDGEAISESGADDAVTVVYIWHGTDGISNATITFYNNAVFSKAQTGLQ